MGKVELSIREQHRCPDCQCMKRRTQKHDGVEKANKMLAQLGEKWSLRTTDDEAIFRGPFTGDQALNLEKLGAFGIDWRHQVRALQYQNRALIAKEVERQCPRWFYAHAGEGQFFSFTHRNEDDAALNRFTSIKLTARQMDADGAMEGVVKLLGHLEKVIDDV